MKRITACLAILLCAWTTWAARPALAEEKLQPYDTELRMVFGFGYGKDAVRDEAFALFIKETVTPVFKDGSTVGTARGQWMHPQRGPIQERNAVLILQYKADAETETIQDKVARAFLKRFPKSNASVYMVRMPIQSAKIFY